LGLAQDLPYPTMPHPRLTLFQTLSALPAPQFEQLRFTLNSPPGIVPEGVAAQGNRVAALLSWAEGATGCGLEHLYEVLEQLCPGCLGDKEGKNNGEEPPWMVPYGRNPYFTGRDEVLTTLYQQLNEGQTAAISQTQAISGLGGIGKTQTAVEYAYRYRDDYRYVFWVGADTELELTSGYVAIAQTLNLPLKDAENQDETVQSVRVWLGRETGWLLIFDNADHPELVQPFLPREIKGHILVTSRAQDFQDLGIVQPVTMETLNPEEAIAFLLNRTGCPNPVGAHPRVRPAQGSEPITDTPNAPNPTVADSGQSRGIAPTEYAAATDLAAELGYLPLALEQAAAYIVTNRVPFANYLNSYRKQRLKRLEKAKPKLGHYPDSVATTWALNLKEVQKQAPAAAALLNYCAFLHADAIPFNLFTQGAAELGEPLAMALADAADDPLDLYDLLNPLGGYSLVRVEPESQSFSLHRLMQEVIRAELGDEGCQNWVEPLFRAIAQLTPEKGKDFDYQAWLALAPLVNHVQELASHCQQHAIAFTEAADVFHVMGGYLLERGQYALAEPLLQKALDLRRNLLGNEHEDIAASLGSLGQLENDQGRYEEAEPLYQMALIMRKRLLGDEHLDVASSLNSLASLYHSQGRYSEAEPLYQAALTMCKRLLGNEHPYVAISLNALARFYSDQGRYSEAKPLFQNSLVMIKRLLGDEHPTVATILNNLAMLYYNQGLYSEAEPLLQDALGMRKRLLGDEHPLIALGLNNLALLHDSQGRYSEADSLYQSALVMHKRLLGDGHPNVALNLSNLANLYRNQGRYDEAEPYFSKALQLLRQLLGEDHPNVGRVTENLGILCAAQGRTEEARSLYQQALAILEPKLGVDHPWTGRCRENLAKLGDGE
ncbi:tetratricopeptide repeat protein, partial [Nodosilinea sp. LEGE 07298]|uniref:FxSxx-COOH system tetratricopeptide repeat protein n=1 Tax=Nodosilinea sp. LEGE 07298 TaxID=2777970 RepID=UPI00188010CC